MYVLIDCCLTVEAYLIYEACFVLSVLPHSGAGIR